jgi:hypothetical protein
VGFVATGPPANQWLALHLRVMREEHDYGLGSRPPAFKPRLRRWCRTAGIYFPSEVSGSVQGWVAQFRVEVDNFRFDSRRAHLC